MNRANGSLTYTVPIDVPPGVNGMAPHLAMQYNSSAGNGPEGVGWSLSGLSQIIRCPQTIATNGVAGGVNDDGNDRFCLDGQQLIAVPGPGQSAAGAYGANGTYYAKEIDDFSEIVSYGNTNPNGSFPSPAYFLVHTKSGLTLEFGNYTAALSDPQVWSASRNVVETWALDQVTDQQSNYMTISYSNGPVSGDASTGVIYPTQILYAGNFAKGTGTTNKITFGWQTRTDSPILYAAGTPHELQDQLSSITTYAGSTQVFQYTMQYKYGNTTQRSTLTSISNLILPGLVFTYTDAQIDTQSDLISNISNSLGASTNIYYYPPASIDLDSINYNNANEVYPLAVSTSTDSVVRAIQHVVALTSYSGVTLVNTTPSYIDYYTYAAPESNLVGRGYLGFQYSNVSDIQTGLFYQKLNIHNFPFIGAAQTNLQLDGNGGPCVDCFQNGYNSVTSAQGTTFPYLSGYVETRNDIAPGANFSSPVISGALPTIAVNYVYDTSSANGGSWGNLVQEISATSDGYSDEKTMTYQTLANTTTWLPELETQDSDTAYGAVQGNGQSFTNAVQTLVNDEQQGASAQTTSLQQNSINYLETNFVLQHLLNGAALGQTRTTNYAYGNDSSCAPPSAPFEVTPAAPNEICAVVTQPGGGNNIQSTANYAYDVFGNVLAKNVSGSDLNGANPTTKVAYDTQGQFPISLTNALNQTEYFGTDARFGYLDSITDINNQTTTFQYNQFAFLTQKTNPDGTFTAYSYIYWPYGGPANTAIQQQFFASDGKTQVAPETIKSYDGLGRDIYDDVQTFNACAANSYLSRTAHIYDTNGNLAQVTNPYCYGAQPVFTTNTSDELGRVIQSVNPDGSVDTTSYAGQTVTATNGLGQTSTVYKDGHGNVSWSQDSIGDRINFVYDGFDQRTQVTDQNGNITSYVYDILGRQTSGIDPDKGAWSATYNSLGELTNTADAVGNTSQISYDLLGRMIQRVETGAAGYTSLTGNWTYDPTNGVGELGSETSSGTASPSGQAGVVGFTKNFYYDSLGRVSQEVLGIAGGQTVTTALNANFDQEYGYDSASRLVSLVTPTGNSFSYTYNGTGYLNQISQASTGTPLWRENASDAANKLTSASYGTAINQSIGYDINERITSESAGVAGATPLQSFGYTYDVLNNVLSKTNGVTQSLPTAFTEYYSYDGLNRLCSVNSAGASHESVFGPTQACGSQPANFHQGGSTPAISVQYYNQIGALAWKDDVGIYRYPNIGLPGQSGPVHGVGTISSYNGGPNFNSTFTYDADGNMLSGDNRTVTYTAFGMTQAVTQGTQTDKFYYDADHNRVVQTSPGAYIAYLDGSNYWRVPGSNNVEYDNFFKDNNGQKVGEMVQTITPTGASTPTAKFFLNDWQNSVANITDANGNLLECDSYDAWGKPRFCNGMPDTNDTITSQSIYGYTNQEHVRNVGLIDLNARMYDPYIGSMLAVDPAVANWADPQSWNAYAYARNNPLRYTDPTGMTPSGNDSSGVTPQQLQALLAMGGTYEGADFTLSGAGGTFTYTDSQGDSETLSSATFGLSGGGTATISSDGSGGFQVTSGSSGGGTSATNVGGGTSATSGGNGVVRAEYPNRDEAMGGEVGEEGALKALERQKWAEKQQQASGWQAPAEAQGKIPTGWGPGQPNSKGAGWRWQDPNDVGNGVRIDRGNPNNSLPSQQGDHVVVRSGGVVLDQDGNPIAGSIKQNAEAAHIPLDVWLSWSSWNKP